MYVPVEVEAWAPRVVRGAPLGPPLPDVPALDLLATPVVPTPVEVPGTSPAATTAPARTSPLVMMSPTRININTATQAELEVLPGIGPSLAKAIIDHRQQHGPFKTLQDVDKVRGIGPKMLDKIGPMLVFEEPKPTRPATRPSGTAGTATPSPSPRGPK